MTQSSGDALLAKSLGPIRCRFCGLGGRESRSQAPSRVRRVCSAAKSICVSRVVVLSSSGQVGEAPEHPSWSDGLDIYDTDGQHLGTSTAWQAGRLRLVLGGSPRAGLGDARTWQLGSCSSSRLLYIRDQAMTGTGSNVLPVASDCVCCILNQRVAEHSCLWWPGFQAVPQVIPRLPDGRILFQRRADWKWRMGGLWDLGERRAKRQHSVSGTA